MATVTVSLSEARPDGAVVASVSIDGVKIVENVYRPPVAGVLMLSDSEDWATWQTRGSMAFDLREPGASASAEMPLLPGAVARRTDASATGAVDPNACGLSAPPFDPRPT